MNRDISPSTHLHDTPRSPMPVAHRLPFRWLILTLFVLSLLLSTLLAAERDTACVPHDLTHALHALSRTAAAVLEGRPTTAPPDSCLRIARPVRDDMTPTI